MKRPVEPVPPPVPTRDWFVVVAVSLLALAAAVAQWWLLRDLKQLPSPLFGGDYVYQSGCIRSILASGNPMASCSCSGALPGYLPLYGTLAAAVVRITGLPVLNAMFLISVLTHAASTLAVAWVVGRQVGARAGFVVACLWTVICEPAVLRYSEFTAQLIIPFFFDALLRYLREPRPRHAMRVGLMLAILGYAHAVAFVASVMVTAISAAIALGRRARAEGLAAAARSTAIELAITGAGAALAIGYWYQPLFVYHGRTSPHYAEWNGGPSLELWADRLAYAGSVLGRLLNLRPAAEGALHLLFLAGAATLVSAGMRRRFAPIAIALVATLVWMFHFFLSMPLLHTHFVPEYVRRMLWAFVLVLVSAIPLALLFERLSPRTSSMAVAASLAAAWVGLAGGARALARDDMMVAAHAAYAPQYLELAGWVEAHTGPDEVVLSTNELSFAWAALTGRKTLVARRAHNDGFLDMEDRNRDAALILYGRDQRLRRERLARWHVGWLLWTTDWVSSEFVKIDSTRIAKTDPLCWFSDADRDSSAARAGVKLLHMDTWVDPAMHSADIPQFNLTLVSPENYERPERPWRPALDSLLEQAWYFEEGGRRLATLYRVRLE